MSQRAVGIVRRASAVALVSRAYARRIGALAQLSLSYLFRNRSPRLYAVGDSHSLTLSDKPGFFVLHLGR